MNQLRALVAPAGMLSQPFMQHALLAGTAVALAAGLVGYLLVLRAQIFTADALSHVAFTGALAALAAGVEARIGVFVLTVLVALGMGALGTRAHPDDVIIGGLFAWILGVGVLFLSIYTTTRSGAGNGAASVSVLFGSIFGLSAGRAATTAVMAAAVCAIMLLIIRPLLFASLDADVAQARGVPVRLLGFGFLALVAVTAAEASQVIGALLILGLLAAPAGAAARLTARPLAACALSAAVAVASMWIGLTASYVIPTLPPSFTILAAATLTYVAAASVDHVRGQLQSATRPSGAQPAASPP